MSKILANDEYSIRQQREPSAMYSVVLCTPLQKRFPGNSSRTPLKTARTQSFFITLCHDASNSKAKGAACLISRDQVTPRQRINSETH
jgi:hypothetical protein